MQWSFLSLVILTPSKQNTKPRRNASSNSLTSKYIKQATSIKSTIRKTMFSGLLTLLFLVYLTVSTNSESLVPNARPAFENRTFISRIVEETLITVGPRIADDTIRQIFTNCLPNTLDTTVLFHRPRNETFLRPYSYVITGDIPVLWLRDSAFQVEPYIPLARDDPALSDLILGLINTQAEMLVGYPWANAYYPLDHWNSGIIKEPNIWAENDTVYPAYDKLIDNSTVSNSTVFEAKFELDSLACFLRLSSHFYEETGNYEFVGNLAWVDAVKEVLRVMKLQQGGTLENLGEEPYNFTRPTRTQSETQNLYGRGNPVRRCGLIRSFFRPSDDSTIFQYLIPSNAFAVVGLRSVGRMLQEIGQLPQLIALGDELVALGDEVDTAIKQYGIVTHPEFGSVYAFEVDCFGSMVLMDDAGYPNLISLPNLGYGGTEDDIYLNTRKYVLSSWNPYYTIGTYPSVGSPHAGLQQSWPMALAMQGLTSVDELEILNVLWVLRNTTAGEGLMHETFDVNYPANFTRPWFAWANSLFGQFILHLDKNYPHLLEFELN